VTHVNFLPVQHLCFGGKEMKCYYEVLEIETTASDEEIKKKYKQLALKYHPGLIFRFIFCNLSSFIFLSRSKYWQ
jgi:hypothetical protein